MMPIMMMMMKKNSISADYFDKPKYKKYFSKKQYQSSEKRKFLLPKEKLLLERKELAKKYQANTIKTANEIRNQFDQNNIHIIGSKVNPNNNHPNEMNFHQYLWAKR